MQGPCQPPPSSSFFFNVLIDVFLIDVYSRPLFTNFACLLVFLMALLLHRQIVLKAMERFPAHKRVQLFGCAAVANMCYRHKVGKK